MANVLTATHCIGDRYDPLNLEGDRNFENSNVFNYNCMGFAFQTFSWMHPRVDSGFIDYLYDDRSCDNYEEKFEEDDEDNVEFFTEDEIGSIESEAIQDVVDYNYSLHEFADEENAVDEVFHWGGYATEISLTICIRNILSVMPNVRRVSLFDELKEGEYGVAFATCDHDFHFGVYIPTLKTYCHKMGSRDPETAENLNQIFGEKYDSMRYFFAVKGDFEDIYLDILEQEMKIREKPYHLNKEIEQKWVFMPTL